MLVQSWLTGGGRGKWQPQYVPAQRQLRLKEAAAVQAIWHHACTFNEPSNRTIGGQQMMHSHTTEAMPREQTAEQGLWRAVILDTIQEWLSGPLGRRREAEKYLFDDLADFRLVCESAGMDAGRLRVRLAAFRKAKMGVLACPLDQIINALAAV